MSVCDGFALLMTGYTFLGFNPCFNGCRSAIALIYADKRWPGVSILVLMDVGLRFDVGL